MSQQLGRRSAVVATAILLTGAPLLIGAGVAHADPASPTPATRAPASGHDLVFTGDDLLGVTCTAAPSATSLTVPAESTVRVVNDTNHRARLLIDGVTRGEIADGSAAEVLVHRGPVALALRPNCVIADESSARIEVVLATPSPGFSAQSGSAAPSRIRTANPGAGQPGGGSTMRPGVGRTTAADGNRAAGDGRPSSDAPDWAPMSAASMALGGPESATDAGGGGVAAEPVAAVEPIQQTGPVALLALIATISIVGVSAGAIRAILAQRATRTSPA